MNWTLRNRDEWNWKRAKAGISEVDSDIHKIEIDATVTMHAPKMSCEML